MIYSSRLFTTGPAFDLNISNFHFFVIFYFLLVGLYIVCVCVFFFFFLNFKFL
jgi:hypothetical protein